MSPPSARPEHDLPRILLPAQDRTETEEAWHAELEQAVQRAYDLALYLDAQSAAADQRADHPLATLRADQAARAQHAYQRVRRHASQIIGRPVTVVPFAAMPSTGRLHVGDVTLDIDHQVVLHRDSEIHLTAAERTCLGAFAVQPHRTWSREALMHLVHGADPHVEVMSRAIDIHLCHLRRKLDQPIVSNVYGIGWRLAEGVHVSIDASTSTSPPDAVARAVRDRQARWIGGTHSADRPDGASFDRLRRALEAFDTGDIDRLSDEQVGLLESRLRLIMARLGQRDARSPDNSNLVERHRASRAASAASSSASPPAAGPPSSRSANPRARSAG